MQFSSNADLVAHLQNQLNEVLFGEPDDAKEVIDRHVSPDYVQIINGSRLEYDEFVAHIRHLRTTLSSGTIKVLEAAQDGDIIADRHTMTATYVSGKKFAGSVHAFVQLGNDGRIIRVNEISQIDVAEEGDPNFPNSHKLSQIQQETDI
jgi:ketosteroid isomerase-like protein